MSANVDSVASQGGDGGVSSGGSYVSMTESAEVGGVLGKGLEKQITTVPTIEKNNVDHPKSSSRFLSIEKETFLITMSYMSLGAIMGALLRIATAQFFGEECANPGTVGWLASASPLCVTRDGEVSVAGIIFADLPANMLGSFIMGMMLSGNRLRLPYNLPIAWLPANHFFQSYDIIHLAIRTGFCGSLTTFSSWNSEMVILVYGAGQTHSQLMRALLGYIIGMETALGSFAFGSKVVLWIFRSINPSLAKEADAQIEKREEGVHISSELPDFERRYLSDLKVENEERFDSEMVKLLDRYRASTMEARRVRHHLLPALIEIERCLLADKQPMISVELDAVARKAGWDLSSLRQWIMYREGNRSVDDTWSPPKQKPEYSLYWALALFLLVYVTLFYGLLSVDGDDSVSITYRTMLYACIFAPPGALLRWKLGAWNGKLKGELSWLPAGTLFANIFGSIVSIACIAIELRLAQIENFSFVDGFWAVGTLRSIKIGFSGCLTTVSTFVSEVDGFLKCPTLPYRGYLYILMSLGTSSVIGVLVYGLTVHVF